MRVAGKGSRPFFQPVWARGRGLAQIGGRDGEGQYPRSWLWVPGRDSKADRNRRPPRRPPLPTTRRSAGEVEGQICGLRAELLRREQDNERIQMDLAREKEERERAQRKVDSMTRLMLHAGGEDPGGRGKKRENRRETWCPGAGQRKRPLLMPGLAEEGEGDEAAAEAVAGDASCAPASRRSDGGALLSALAEESGEDAEFEQGEVEPPRGTTGNPAAGVPGGRVGPKACVDFRAGREQESLVALATMAESEC